MTRQRTWSVSWRAKAAYIIGAAISFIAAFGLHFFSSSTITEVRIVWGLVVGSITWAFFLVPQVGVQFLLRLLLRRMGCGSINVETVLLNVPVVVSAILLMAYAVAASNPVARFQRFVTSPIPPSVQRVQHGGTTGVDGVFWAFRFEVSGDDVNRLVKKLQFAPDANAKGKAYWERRIFTRAGIVFDLREPYFSYVSRVNGVERRLFLNSDTSVAFFIYCTYRTGA